MSEQLEKAPILIGRSKATVCRVRRADGAEWIEKSGPSEELRSEAEAMQWCAPWLPVPAVIASKDDLLTMSALPGVNLAEVSRECAVAVLAEAMAQIHSVPVEACPLQADWSLRLQQAEAHVRAGMVDETDFDESHRGRTAQSILKELQTLPPLEGPFCFTHGDACLPNFLSDGKRLTGIVDLGRAGVTHPAQDWALALRSMRYNFGPESERMLREHLPPACTDEALLGRFLMLDELF